MTINETVTNTAIYDKLFDKSLGHSQDRAILIDAANSGRSFTLKDFKRKIPIFASKLGTIWPNFRGGDIVVQCSVNDIDLVAAAQGFIYAGATVASVDHTRDDEEAIVRDIQTVGAKYIVTHPRIVGKLLRAAEKLDIPKGNILVCGDRPTQGVSCLSSLWEGEEIETGALPVMFRDTNDPAFLMFTSGSTGPSKVVNVSFRAILHMLDISESVTGSDQRLICFSQLYHAAATTLIMTESILKGIPTYLMEKFVLEDFCKYIQEYKVTTTFMMPYVAATIARNPSVNNYNMSSLKYVIVLGEHPDTFLVRDFKEKFDVDLLNLYGMTEALPPFRTSLEYSKKGAVGKLAPKMQAKLLDDEGKDAKEGELWLKGPTITPGYYNNEKATKEVFDDQGFFCTGDIFKVDDNGIFTFVSRKKEMIKVGVFRIHPSEAEKLVLQAPKVSRCAVVGIYDNQICADLLTAFIERTETAEDNEKDEKALISIAQGVMGHVNSLADSHAVEDCFRLRGGVLVVDKLPHTVLGKVARAKLREIPGNFRHAYFQ